MSKTYKFTIKVKLQYRRLIKCNLDLILEKEMLYQFETSCTVMFSHEMMGR